MSMQNRLQGKVVAITGGARGIGAAAAAALAQAGATVVIGDIDRAAAEETAAAIGKAVTAHALDVADSESFAAFLDAAQAQSGPLDVLINNAGIMPLSRAEEEPSTTTTQILAVNLQGVIHGCKQAVMRMKPRRSGHIVNVASVAAKVPLPGAATYAASKAGVLAYSDALRAELHGSGIEVSCVLPGIVDTELATGIAVRGFHPIAPKEVADALVDVLERPRFEVFVPRQAGIALRATSLGGRRLSEWLQHALRADTPMLEAIGSAERTDYEKRARQQRST
ncbi:SDR family NAD(P)-dependent oxidoreductase [Hoyosella subflava]|uniref:Cis-2,3-dihydrobiphenyl-2,3-diol dehydrogenase n=1 Tax=Hoyosella subflava (strain DSM 45089 / JCM 17490 / NBRC 109087 / DQS3-9A1) TaxID=443218 RepID=F6EN74_HOYSD|nr:SDR family NAD(P)-dependent oxidoreductase [Hoyosella subflava]AEF39391.1 Cis-2,3-dihydrobiphenyl-2,3-diol dehydrogenase [Hoyosella subflava DQS3-9A1]